MLPRKLKTLSQIASFTDPDIRVYELGRLLEYLLSTITANLVSADGKKRTLRDFIVDHKSKFSDFRSLRTARLTRNRAAHVVDEDSTSAVANDAEITDTEYDFAEVAFKKAIQDILPHCEPSLREEVAGQPDSSGEYSQEIPRSSSSIPPPPRSSLRFTEEPSPRFEITPWERRKMRWWGTALITAGVAILYFFGVSPQLAKDGGGQGPPHPHTVSVDLALYCITSGLSTGATNVDGTAYGWRCMPNNTKIDMNRVCQQQFGPSYRGVLTSPPPGGPRDWACSNSQTTPPVTAATVPPDTPSTPVPSPPQNDVSPTGLPSPSLGLPTGIPPLVLPPPPGDGADSAPAKVYTWDASMTRPVLISKREPEYTEEARRDKISGLVVLKFVLTPEGRPVDFQVVQSLNTGLDRSAIDCVQTWRWKPVLKDNVPVAIWAQAEVHFVLQ